MNAFTMMFGELSNNSKIVAGMMPNAPKMNVAAISRIGSCLYLSLTRMYLSNNAAGATAKRSNNGKLANFYLSVDRRSCSCI